MKKTPERAQQLSCILASCDNIKRIFLWFDEGTTDEAFLNEDPAFQLFDGKLKLTLTIQTEALLTIFKEVHDNVTRQVGIARRKVRLLLKSHVW